MVMQFFNSTLLAKPILELGNIKVTERDLLKEKNRVESLGYKSRYSDITLLTGIFEKKLWSHLLEKLNIGSSFKDKETYFNKHHPDLLSKKIFNQQKEYFKNITNALDDILNKTLNEDDSYKKHMSQIMTKEEWKVLLKQNIGELSASFKDELKKPYSEHVNEVMNLLALSSTYAKGAVAKKICELEKVEHSSCSEESSIWLKAYFKKNHVLHDKKLKGFETGLSFYRELQVLNYMKSK